MRLHEDIHNYYEKIVVEEVIKLKLDEKYDEDVMADFCCTVLISSRHDIFATM